LIFFFFFLNKNIKLLKEKENYIFNLFTLAIHFIFCLDGTLSINILPQFPIFNNILSKSAD